VCVQRSNDENGNCSGGSMEFPTTNLYELESRVFTDHWSIPYKREESLGKCLIAATCLARLGKTPSVCVCVCGGSRFSLECFSHVILNTWCFMAGSPSLIFTECVYVTLVT